MEYKFNGSNQRQIQIGSYNFTKALPRAFVRPQNLEMLLSHPNIERVND